MMLQKQRVLAILGLLLLARPALAVISKSDASAPGDSRNPYSAIVDRNVFGLKPPPAAPDPEANKPPPPKITPQGITTIFGNKRAVFKVQMPPRPPEPAKEQAFILAEGEREGQVEVLEIDEKAGSIKFNNFGTVMTLTLEKDGAKLPNTPPPAVPPPGMTVQPGAVSAIPQPAPGINPYTGQSAAGVTTIGGAGAGLKSIPTRTLRLPNSPAGNAGALATPQSLSAGQLGTGQQSQLSHEEQIILMEVERERTKAAVANGQLPPLPPTDLTPPGGAPVRQPVPPAPQ